jgi:hypothetical protein
MRKPINGASLRIGSMTPMCTLCLFAALLVAAFLASRSPARAGCDDAQVSYDGAVTALSAAANATNFEQKLRFLRIARKEMETGDTAKITCDDDSPASLAVSGQSLAIEAWLDLLDSKTVLSAIHIFKDSACRAFVVADAKAAVASGWSSVDSLNSLLNTERTVNAGNEATHNITTVIPRIDTLVASLAPSLHMTKPADSETYAKELTSKSESAKVLAEGNCAAIQDEE